MRWVLGWACTSPKPISNEIDVYIRRLRTKIERNSAEPEYLLTVRGIGYKLRTPNR